MGKTEEKEIPHRAWGSILSSLIILSLIITITTGLINRWTNAFPNAGMFLWPLIILFFTVIIAKIASQLLHRYFERAAKHLNVFDRTRYSLFAKVTTVLIYLVGISIAGSFIPTLRNLSVSLFASAGILAIVIGFATQKTIGNLFSGIMIAIYQPYRIGDRIKVGEEYGTVEDITLRQTVIATWDNRRIIVPNSKMDEEVINNYTIEDPKMLGWFDIGISYDSDIDLAREIMKEEALRHPNFLDNRTETDVLTKEDPVMVRVVKTNDSSVDLRLYFWAADQPTNWRMKCDLIESIKKRFDKEGVEIPFPYRTIIYKKDIPKPRRVLRGGKRRLARKR